MCSDSVILMKEKVVHGEMQGIDRQVPPFI